ncbi:glycoside hydrolase family 95 protein [Fulvivirga sediminis]|uniref:Glycoside hydrolase family 95 protein n=1 Tax=Fulvivirga sediminis TaxID=2803949 RepID=A0A937F7K4_9BACT|nr:glycoside hydrolase family 95 protein [Fulvivirga sediminis]MBL3657200.1 glycoside hydrolase family 95 protein [Fulvivirga sediminis]
MKKLVLLLLALPLWAQAQSTKASQDSLLKLWYQNPANRWEEALPVGNGRLGAMVFGDPAHEVIQLNENTVYAGQPNRNDNPLAKEALPEVRQLIFEKKFKEAEAIINEKFITKKSHGMPYQVLGNLKLNFENHDSYKDYKRELDISRAITTSSYEANGVKYKTEVFSSFPDQVIAMRITADKKGAINFSANLDRPAEVQVTATSNQELIMTGTTSDHEGVVGGVKFTTIVKIITENGQVRPKNGALQVSNADAVTLYISAGTNFINYKDISGNADERAVKPLQAALNKSYDQIRKAHIADYQKYFNRVTLDLGTTNAIKKPTDQRIADFAAGNDPQLVALYFQFGRYLLISSSRTGGQPANLQGIWAHQLNPPWDSKYTVNINTEMNYWPSEVTNLSETNEPLIKMVTELSESGRKTAEDMYGAKGWVLHHNTDIWRINGPVDGAFWGMWPMGGAWFSQHLIYKYQYSGDKQYLSAVYPVLKGACEFYLDFLIEDTEHHWLVVSPSISPENAPAATGTSIAAGTTMDNQLVFDLFTHTAEVAGVLDKDPYFIKSLQQAIAHLPPMQIGQWGQLQEWMYDWDQQGDHHRHVSHLYGLYPSNQISPYHTPELFQAAKTSLLARGDESTGWSMGWKVNLWARLLEGDHALKLIKDQLTPAIKENVGEKGGTYPNLFDAHPPFQIDGNFGCTAGIAEMLMQSHDGAIHILPALPGDWEKGGINGLRARGGFGLDIHWDQNKPNEIILRSELGGNCRIRSYYPLSGKGLKPASGKNENNFYQIPDTKEALKASGTSLLKPDLRKVYEYDLNTSAGKTYILKGEK